jgi:hypothetical protein
LNVGAGVGGGIAIGDIEGDTVTLDINAGPSVQLLVWEAMDPLLLEEQ